MTSRAMTSRVVTSRVVGTGSRMACHARWIQVGMKRQCDDRIYFCTEISILILSRGSRIMTSCGFWVLCIVSFGTRHGGFRQQVLPKVGRSRRDRRRISEGAITFWRKP